MAKTYDNQITVAEVSLAIERLLVGPSTADWLPGTTGKVNIGSLTGSLTGFVDLGAVVEDSPTMTVTREKYSLELGLPRGLQYQAVIGISGELDFRLWAKSNDIAKEALGVNIVTITTAVGPHYGTRAPFGTTLIKHYGVIGVADFLDGSQVVHHFPDCTPKDEYTEEIRPDAAGQLMVAFDAISFLSTIHQVAAANQRIVGERVYFA